jgi:hypothetical protein
MRVIDHRRFIKLSPAERRRQWLRKVGYAAAAVLGVVVLVNVVMLVAYRQRVPATRWAV